MSASRQSLRRPAPSRRVKPLVLIVCEGEKTEPQYFDRFRQAKRLSATFVEVVPGGQCGSNPKSVVEYTKKRAKEQKRERLPFNHVWCVFDRDDHQRWDEALTQARDNKFCVAFSNPCFELWILLHYEYQSAQIDRGVVVNRVQQYLPDYSKSSDVYHALLGKQAEAVRNAQRLRAYHAGNCDPDTHNPSTSVDLLVECLNGLEVSRVLTSTPAAAASSNTPARRSAQGAPVRARTK